MIGWIDVSPYAWFYRDVIDAGKVQLDPATTERLFESIPYNRFKSGKGKIVRSYISTENQIEFDLPGYVPASDNPVLVYVEGTPVNVGTDLNKVFLPNPITAGLEVVVMAMGVPELTDMGCHSTPTINQKGIYPSAELSKKANYIFDFNYTLNEVATAMGRKLIRVEYTPFTGESIQDALGRIFRYRRGLFTIIDGVLYTSFEYWNVPVTVEYNYTGANGQVLHRSEKVIPTSAVVTWNDRFFPNVTLQRADFMVLLQRLRRNLYNRFTDRVYEPVLNNERNISDININRWYAEDVLDILNEKYLDGCYVFPLYEDGTFNPEGCITRAEAVTFLHRFIEWSLERFR